ncbi:hypothetical protein RUM43_007676 [Polyplax serrata]|uniref:Uncharacterized protein n=1 Tax=Polyplax serrata TaxID=468196 RepID=A0AAN8Q6C3_POLSC
MRSSAMGEGCEPERNDRPDGLLVVRRKARKKRGTRVDSLNLQVEGDREKELGGIRRKQRIEVEESRSDGSLSAWTQMLMAHNLSHLTLYFSCKVYVTRAKEV